MADEKLSNAVNVYAEMLKCTKEVFGAENMSESVMIQAIETAGYAVWRSIMGGKFKDDKDDKDDDRNWKLAKSTYGQKYAGRRL